MNKDLSHYRKSYEKGELSEKSAPENPLELFQKWFHEVEEFFSVDEANAMTLSTNDSDGFPRSRIVLLKRFTYEGFVFFTNYNSKKGLSIQRDPNVCLSFFWHAAERQVIIKGTAEKLAENLSDGYFETRPRGSQLSAHASDQSEVVENREVLESRMRALEQKYEGKHIPRPENWGGFLVRPLEMEFWQGRSNRLHDRLRYALDEEYNWILERLAP